MDERRLKIFWVREQDVLTAFCRPWEHHSVLTLPDLKDVPAGATVVSVRHCWERRCFGFLVRHESFAPVPEGAMFPSDDQVTELRAVQFHKLEGFPFKGGMYSAELCPAWDGTAADVEEAKRLESELRPTTVIDAKSRGRPVG